VRLRCRTLPRLSTLGPAIPYEVAERHLIKMFIVDDDGFGLSLHGSGAHLMLWNMYEANEHPFLSGSINECHTGDGHSYAFLKVSMGAW